MYLRSVRIENYRAIREASLSLDQMTILIGENDCGRSSIIEALMLILGPSDAIFEKRLQPFHFHRRPDGSTGALRIILQLDEESPTKWRLPESISQTFPPTPGRRREMEFEFTATLHATTQHIDRACSVKSLNGPASVSHCKSDVLDWLRTLVPVLWLHFGLMTPVAELVKSVDADAVGINPQFAELELRYRNLVTGNTPDFMAEIEEGARAARNLMKMHPHLFAGAAPMMTAMASEILNPRQATTVAATPEHSTTAHKIGLLLLLGSMIQLAHRTLLPEGMPVLVIENPESNLHPITLATAWRLIERLAWQKIIVTNSGMLLSNTPLSSIRRLTRTNGIVTEWSVPPRALSRENLRRISYHLRSRRSTAMFARCWLLVEGETEFWIVPELARICGFDFAAEGVVCVEFAQCGLVPLIKMAERLGITWHVLADGDEAGQKYAEAASTFAGSRSPHVVPSRVTRLQERDIEHCFWNCGFSDVIQRVANSRMRNCSGTATATIRKAVEKTSKPFLALSLIDALSQKGPTAVPPALREMIAASIQLARQAPSPNEFSPVFPSASREKVHHSGEYRRS